jgi:hypothetical protein
MVWRMRGRLRIWQRAVGRRGGRKKGEAPGEGGREDRKKNLLSLFALLLEQDTLGFFLIFFGETEPPNFRLTPHTAGQIDHLSTKSQPVLTGLDPSTVAPEGCEWYH